MIFCKGGVWEERLTTENGERENGPGCVSGREVKHWMGERWNSERLCLRRGIEH